MSHFIRVSCQSFDQAMWAALGINVGKTLYVCRDKPQGWLVMDWTSMQETGEPEVFVTIRPGTARKSIAEFIEAIVGKDFHISVRHEYSPEHGDFAKATIIKSIGKVKGWQK